MLPSDQNIIYQVLQFQPNLYLSQCSPLTLLHSERPKLYTILVFLCSIGFRLETHLSLQLDAGNNTAVAVIEVVCFYLFERILLMLVLKCQIIPSIYISTVVSICDNYSLIYIFQPSCSKLTTSLVKNIVS